MRWRTCAPEFGRHRLDRPDSFVGYSSSVVPHERMEHEIPGHQASPGPVRWRTCAPDFGRHRLNRPESSVGYSSLVVPHERIEHDFGRHRLERPESSVGGRRNVVPHERRLTSRGAGGGTRCRVPPPDPFFPEDRASFCCPPSGYWNQFSLSERPDGPFPRNGVSSVSQRLPLRGPEAAARSARRRQPE